MSLCPRPAQKNVCAKRCCLLKNALLCPRSALIAVPEGFQDEPPDEPVSNPSKLSVGPASLLPLLQLGGLGAAAFGPYWVVATGKEMQPLLCSQAA